MSFKAQLNQAFKIATIDLKLLVSRTFHVSLDEFNKRVSSLKQEATLDEILKKYRLT